MATRFSVTKAPSYCIPTRRKYPGDLTMGTLQLVADPDNLPRDVLERVFLTDVGGKPTHCRCSWEKPAAAGTSGVLRLQFEGDDSHYVNIPWMVESGASMLLATATLRQRDQPYVLSLEILRGLLHRITNQVAEWQAAAFTVLDPNESRLSQLLSKFSTAATRSHDVATCHRVSVQAITTAIELLDDIGNRLTQQFAQANQDTVKTTLIGSKLPATDLSKDHEETFCSFFDTAAIDTNWLSLIHI